MPDAPAAEALGDADRQFLTFRVGERRYALPTKSITEVVRVPPVARLPLSPRPLMGLANLRGSVLPVVSLSALLGQPAPNAASAARAIILTGVHSAALVVDAVEGLVSREAGRIDTTQAHLTADQGEHLAGVFSVDGEEHVTRILDVDRMLASQFAPRRGARQPMRHDTAPRLLNEAEKTTARLALIAFDVAGQVYALALSDVHEIIAVPAAVSVIPRAEAVLLGVIAYRDGLLPMLSLRVLLGFASTDRFDGREKVIVTRVGDALVGLVADRMQAIVRADPKLIEATPSMLAARAGGEARIKAIFRDEGGRRLISILSTEQLFREDVLRALGDGSGTADAALTTEQSDRSETVQFLVFRLGSEAYGLPIGAVDEVARVPHNIARVPNTPDFLEGVVNLRGNILPVIDQRKRFGLPSGADRDEQRLVVVRTDLHRAGLIVDSVSAVLRLSGDLIEPAPDLIGETNHLINAVVSLEAEGEMVLLLDPSELLSQVENRLLDAFTPAAADLAEP